MLVGCFIFLKCASMMKRNASVARCAPNPARSSSIGLDLRSVTLAALSCDCYRSSVVICNYYMAR